MPRKLHEESQYRCACACNWTVLPMYTDLQIGKEEGTRSRCGW